MGTIKTDFNTGSSATIANSFQQYRELGAKTRAMLIAVAANRWHVNTGERTTANSAFRASRQTNPPSR
jgi:hypothetical protein